MKSGSLCQPPLHVPGIGVTSSLARTMPLTDESALETTLPCHTGLTPSIGPAALRETRKTVSALAFAVVISRAVPSGAQVARSDEQDSQYKESRVSGLMDSRPLPSSSRSHCIRMVSAAAAESATVAIATKPRIAASRRATRLD